MCCQREATSGRQPGAAVWCGRVVQALGLLVPSGWCLGVVHGCGVAWFEGVCGWEGGGVTEFREALAQATVLLGELAHLDRSVLSDAELVVLLEA